MTIRRPLPTSAASSSTAPAASVERLATEARSTVRQARLPAGPLLPTRENAPADAPNRMSLAPRWALPMVPARPPSLPASPAWSTTSADFSEGRIRAGVHELQELLQEEVNQPTHHAGGSRPGNTVTGGPPSQRTRPGAALPPRGVNNAFGAGGRLLLTPQGDALLNLPGAEQRQQFEVQAARLLGDAAMQRNQSRPPVRPVAAQPAVVVRHDSPEPAPVLHGEPEIVELDEEEPELVPEPSGEPIAAQEMHAAGGSDRAESSRRPPAANRPRVHGAGAAPARSAERRNGILPERVAALHQAQQLLAQGMPVPEVARRVEVPVSTLSNTFNTHGRLLFSPSAAALLDLKDSDRRALFEAMPRALMHKDLATLATCLRLARQIPGGDIRDLGAGDKLPAAVLEQLFDGARLRESGVRALPPAQAAALLAAQAGLLPRGAAVAAAPANQPGQPELRRKSVVMPIARLAALRAAQQMLAQGQQGQQVGHELGLSATTLSNTFTSGGQLLLSVHAEALLRASAAEQRQAFEALPRALRAPDLSMLELALRAARLAPGLDPRLAAAQAGVADFVLNHLFDGPRLRDAGVQTLPAGQAQALLDAQGEPGTPADPQANRGTPTAGATLAPPGVGEEPPEIDLSMLPDVSRPTRRRPAMPQERVTMLHEARQLLVAGLPTGWVADELDLPFSTLSSIFNAQGRLLLRSSGDALLSLPDAAQRQLFEGLPRALRPVDLLQLSNVLREHHNNPLPDLRSGAARVGVAPHALDYLFDGSALREDRLASLPDAQLRLLLAARAGEPEPPASSDEAPAVDPGAAAERPRRARRVARERANEETAERTAEGPAAPADAAPPAAARPARTSARHAAAAVPDGAQAMAALRFMRDQPGAHALARAERQFGLSTVGLLQLLARAGVREWEARTGDIPAFSVLWQRLSGSTQRQPTAGEAGSTEGQENFAAYLEAALQSPMPQPPTASGARKRAAELAPADAPSPVRSRPNDAQDASSSQPSARRRPRSERVRRPEGLWGSVLNWAGSHWPWAQAPVPSPALSDAGRPGHPRTPFEDGLPDPGTPTEGDLGFLDMGGLGRFDHSEFDAAVAPSFQVQGGDDAMDLDDLPDMGTSPRDRRAG